ncbi:MAG: hypothetical protein WC143_07565 [Eubacteriales bacterium]|jgi:hypothetical protein
MTGSVQFNSSRYEIYQMKEQTSDSPLSAESPREEAGAKGHKWAGVAILAAVGVQSAQKVIGALRTEIADTTGSESTQAEFNNVITSIGMITAVVATHGAAAIAYTIQGGTDMILYDRNIKRKNREIAYNNTLRGTRASIVGVIYD